MNIFLVIIIFLLGIWMTREGLSKKNADGSYKAWNLVKGIGTILLGLMLLFYYLSN